MVGARWRGLIDGYVNEQIGICLYIHTWNPSVESKLRDLAFVFQKAGSCDNQGNKRDPSGQPQFGSGVRGPRSDEMQSPVPVDSRPIIDDPERPVKIPHHEIRCDVWSIVRLYGLNEVPTLLREWLNLEGCIVKIFGIAEDRECQALLIGGRVLSAVYDRSLINTSIESRAQLIKHFSEFETGDRGKASEVDWLDPDSPCPVVIHAYDGAISLFLAKVVPCIGEGFAVSLCSLDALPAVLKSPWHKEKPSAAGDSGNPRQTG